MSKLKEKLMLSEKGYSDLKKAITACTITNIALLLPSMVACLLFWELQKPFTGETISWVALWKLLGLGVAAAILVFLAAKNDYRKTYIASYKEASTTRLRIAEHLRKLPMSFFNTKDLSDITTNMMADCSSMESMLSSTIPPLIANIISVTLTCICLAFFDWRMALAIFCTMPVTFLIIWCGRKLQLRLFDKQVDVKLEASSQIQEYLEGIKIIKSCGLGGSRFSTLDKALQAMRKIAIKVELASGILVQGASLILQAGLGITIFIGTVLITSGEIELLPLLVLLMQTINLKQYYPFCTEDTFVEVSDEIVEAFLLDKRAEAARERKMYRYKAFYSLDCNDGIENAAIGWAQPSPEDYLMEKEAQAEYAELLRRLYEAISSLPPTQARRVHARYMLGMKVKDIAAMEGITPSQAGKSIHAALRRLRRYFICRKWTSGL